MKWCNCFPPPAAEAVAAGAPEVAADVAAVAEVAVGSSLQALHPHASAGELVTLRPATVTDPQLCYRAVTVRERYSNADAS